MIMTIQVILHSVLYKKQNLTGYIQYYKKKMVGQTQRSRVRQNPNVRQKKKVFANSDISCASFTKCVISNPSLCLLSYLQLCGFFHFSTNLCCVVCINIAPLNFTSFTESSSYFPQIHGDGVIHGSTNIRKGCSIY